MQSWKRRFITKTIKVGDVLTVRHDLQIKQYINEKGESNVVTSSMHRLRGEKVEVTYSGHGFIKIREDGDQWGWIDCMFEEYKHLERT